MPIGSLDTETSHLLEKEITPILEKSPKGILLDLQKLDYISSMGLGLVFKTKSDMSSKGGVFIIANMKPNIKRTFEAVKAIAETFLATIEGPDEYLDTYIASIGKKDPEPDKK